MTDEELVKRLRRADEYEPLGHDGWDAADRIELLATTNEQLEAARADATLAQINRTLTVEAKLAKAVGAMQEAVRLSEQPHYGDRDDALDHCFDGINVIRATLAEIEGEKE